MRQLLIILEFPHREYLTQKKKNNKLNEIKFVATSKKKFLLSSSVAVGNKLKVKKCCLNE